MSEQKWDTEITGIAQNEILVAGYPLEQLIGNLSFADMFYLLIKKEAPSIRIKKILDAILVSSVDHGPTPPSTIAARTAASTGAELNGALAAGILSINKYHGGAIESCMLLLKEGIKIKEEINLDFDIAANMLVEKTLTNKGTLYGFGHRIHSNDPRAIRLLDLAEENGFMGKFVKMALAIKNVISKVKGKEIPLNVDGAIASLLCEIDFPHELANALFIMARIPGLTAHIYEEKTTQKPMRFINSREFKYSGPARRDIPKI